MPLYDDFALTRQVDGVLYIELKPPVDIGGWSMEFSIGKRQGFVSGLVTKSCASGFGGGVSGITVVTSGTGEISVQINAVDTSGWDQANYAYQLTRLNSGYRTVLSAGFLLAT